jgi:hypothetical protein
LAHRRRFRHDTIALIYDFDGTLTPQPMQDYTVLPALGVEPSAFWADVNAETARTSGDPMLTYMRLLLERMAERGQPISRADLRALGAKIRYFPGVTDWFRRVGAYATRGRRGSIHLKNYIVSAGQKEILEGIPIRRHFESIFASEYFFDRRGIATFPSRVVNDTTKTQYIFRINKGVEDVRESINAHMPEEHRAIPFSNMVYIGDGLTDVPGMTVTKKNGGYAIAVHRPRDARGMGVCKELLASGRIDFYAPADFRADRRLDRRIRLILDIIVAKIRYQREIFEGRLVE